MRVADNLFLQDGVTQWNAIFSWSVQDWEAEMVLSFFEWLYFIQVRHAEEDRLVWSPSKRDQFEVKLFYVVLNRQDDPSFPWKSIWHVKAPSRVPFSVWTIALGKILTHDNLRKKNIGVVEWCYLCKKSGEFIEHLLLYCDIARELWSYILILFGVEWVLPQRVLDLLTSWSDSFGCGPAKEVWRLVPLCLMWYLWLEMNA
jgi:hypothetical protein